MSELHAKMSLHLSNFDTIPMKEIDLKLAEANSVCARFHWLWSSRSSKGPRESDAPVKSPNMTSVAFLSCIELLIAAVSTMSTIDVVV